MTRVHPHYHCVDEVMGVACGVPAETLGNVFGREMPALMVVASGPPKIPSEAVACIRGRQPLVRERFDGDPFGTVAALDDRRGPGDFVADPERNAPGRPVGRLFGCECAHIGVEAEELFVFRLRVKH